jgi:hypothetical protein
MPVDMVAGKSGPSGRDHHRDLMGEIRSVHFIQYGTESQPQLLGRRDMGQCLSFRRTFPGGRGSYC